MYKELLIEMLIFVLFIFFDLDDIGILAGIGKKKYIYIYSLRNVSIIRGL